MNFNRVKLGELLNQNNKVYIVANPSGVIVPEQNMAAIIFFDENNCKEYCNQIAKKFKDANPYEMIIRSFEDIIIMYNKPYKNVIWFPEYGFMAKKELLGYRKEAVDYIYHILKDKPDDFTLKMIRLSDGSEYEKDNSLVFYSDISDAKNVAQQLGGFIYEMELTEIYLNNVIFDGNYYYFNNLLFSGIELNSAIDEKFQNQILSVDEVKQLIDEGLYVIACSNEEASTVLLNYEATCFFTSTFNPGTLPDTILNGLPRNAMLYPITPKEKLYTMLCSDLIFINRTRHTTKNIFENAIGIRSKFHNISLKEKTNLAQYLFNMDYLYILLDDETIIYEEQRANPYIIHTYPPSCWIFTDYGKALLQCQKNNRFSDDGKPLIGIIAKNTNEYNLENVLSILNMFGVKEIDVNPEDETGINFKIQQMLNCVGKKVLNQNEITFDKLESDSYEIIDNPHMCRFLF